MAESSTDRGARSATGALEHLRKKLLDLSKKNTLLNFKYGDRSRTHVRVIDEVPEFLYRRLIDGKEFKLQGITRPEGLVVRHGAPELTWQEVAQMRGLSTSYDLPEPSTDGPDRHNDNAIQLPYFTDKADSNLEGIRQTYRTFIDEMGIPALYAAFGFLEWFERSGDAPQLAPLLLLPLEIERLRAGYGYQYRIRATADEPEVNLSLEEKLRELGVTVPGLPEDESSDALSSYLTQVSVAISGMPGWRVRRHVTIGIFLFARQVMYRDLEASRWQQLENRQDGRGVVTSLLRGASFGSPDSRAIPAAEETFAHNLIRAADPSQRAAIAHALGGESLVIKGPPGTGKSDTITNLISAALGMGKSVLFVAEKMAALNVVKNRLDGAGIGTFCLELHSTKTKKKDLIEELHRSYEARKARPQVSARWDTERELQEIEDDLKAYESILDGSIGALGMPLREIIWTAEQLRNALGRVPELIHGITLDGVESLTPQDLRRDREALQHLQDKWSAVADSQGRSGGHPWRFVETGDLSVQQQDALQSAIRLWCRRLGELRTAVQSLPIAAAELTRPDLMQLHESLRDLPSIRDIPPARLDHLKKARWFRAVETAAVDLQQHRQDTASLRAVSTDLESTLAGWKSIAEVQSISTHAVDLKETLGQARARLANERAAAETAREAALAARRCFELLNEFAPPPALTRSAGHALLALVEEIRKAGHLLALRTDKTTAPHLRSKFDDLTKEAARLTEQADLFDKKYRGWRERRVADLLRHATVLRTAGFFGRLLGSPFKEAQLEYQTLTVGREARRERTDKANDLEEVAQLLERLAAWPASKEVTECAGAFHRGLETDFQSLADCARWAFDARTHLTSVAPDETWAVAVLMSAPEERLHAVVRGLTAGHISNIQAWLTKPGDQSFETWAAGRVSALVDREAAVGAVLELGIRPETPVADLSEVAATASRTTAAADRIASNTDAAAAIPDLWQGVGTPIDPVVRVLEARRGIEALRWNPALWAYVWTNIGENLEQLRGMAGALGEALHGEQEARVMARVAGASADRAWPIDGSLEQALRTIQAAERTEEHLGAWVAFRRAWLDAESYPGPRAFLGGVDWSQNALDQLADAYSLAVYRNLCSAAQRRFPRLIHASMAGAQLEAKLKRFAEREAESQENRRLELRNRLFKREVAEGVSARNRSTELALIAHEASKKMRHISARALMQRAWSAVIGLKPCFMMSPLSVAQFLDSGRALFDLVVIDEASQMRPEDAMGALLRARQVVVVGDKQQLPPTSFFDRVQHGEEDEEEDDDAANVESILDLMLGSQSRTSDLKWHYRSRHESLISFSNREFYDGTLHVVPSPTPGHKDLGVRCELVEAVYGDSTNRKEAQKVADAAIAFMKAHPKRSLGVVAMNLKQAQLIEKLIDERVAESGTYREKWEQSLEALFVKNLESVQGDERDVIFVSLTYGPDEAGHVHRRFFPVNTQGGQRRLNVLFTRAKEQLIIFSSLQPAQIRVDDGISKGVQVLRSYLEYAVACGAAPAAARSAEIARLEDAGHRHLSERLRHHGLEVDHEIGNQNITLPLGVRRSGSGEYACAVDRDLGARTGDGLAVFRDQIRWRSSVLQKCGWKSEFVWTTDWLREPTSAWQDLIRRVEGHGIRPVSKPEKAAPPSQPPIVDLTDPPRLDAIVTETPFSHPILARIGSARHFAEAREHVRWKRLVLPTVELLVRHGGSATHAALADHLGFQRYRIQGVLAEVQEHLNVGQVEVLRFDREEGQVRLDMALLEQLANG